MFRKINDFYNPKIDFKMIYFLNPKVDIKNNYYETRDVYMKNCNFVSEQGMWIKRLKKVYDYLFNNQLNIHEVFLIAAKEFDTKINKEKVDDIVKQYLNINHSDSIYLATWLLKTIIYESPLLNFSDELAILFFNSILKKNSYIPMIFLKDYRLFLKKLIFKKITISSLINVLSIYEDISIKYDNKYKLISKEQVVQIIKANKENLINNLDVTKVWIYGSFVREEANEFSDVDLYVKFSKKKSCEEIDEVQKFFENILERHVDMLIENEDYLNFSSNALKEREVIFDDCK